MRNRKILVLILLLVFISSTAFAQNNTQVVETAKSIKEDISINEIITGILTPIQDVNVPAQIGGVAEKINVEIGEEVKCFLCKLITFFS